MFCKLHQEIQADISCCQEINLDTTQNAVQTIIYKTMQRHWQRSRLTMGSTPIAFSGQYKPGGTLIMSTGSITGRIQETGKDPWGRWSYQTMLGHNSMVITIISTYQPVMASHDKRGTDRRGTYTVAAQHKCLLLQSNDETDNPRTAFRRDLRQFITNQLKHHKAEILILGDFNERMGDDPNGMSSINAEFHLIDIMANRHPSLQEPATYARGSKRLDFALGTHRIAAATAACGYESFHFRFHTDHRAFYLDFHTTLLFGSPTQQLAKRSERGLHSRNVKQVTKYIEEKHALLTDLNVFARAQKLELPGNRHHHAEKLDIDVVSRSLTAEARTSNYKEPLWSIQLIEARKKVSILAKWLSMHKTGVDLQQIIATEQKTLRMKLRIPQTLVDCNSALREAKREVQRIIDNSFELRDRERDRQIADLEADPDRDNKKKARILRNLKKAEDMKQMFQKLQILRQIRANNGITRIEIPIDLREDPKKCTEWQVIDVPTQILHHLQSRNRTHFGQAQNTPFTREPLLTELGFTSHTDVGNYILQGHYDASKLEKSVQLLIAHLQHHQAHAEEAAIPLHLRQ